MSQYAQAWKGLLAECVDAKALRSCNSEDFTHLWELGNEGRGLMGPEGYLFISSIRQFHQG